MKVALNLNLPDTPSLSPRSVLERSFPSTHARIDVLVVLEGPSDDATALVFRDIADTVQDGLHHLGHPSTIVYCTNIAVDVCFVDGRKLIVLAAHNLASFVNTDGRSAVLENKLLPPEAGGAFCCSGVWSCETYHTGI